MTTSLAYGVLAQPSPTEGRPTALRTPVEQLFQHRTAGSGSTGTNSAENNVVPLSSHPDCTPPAPYAQFGTAFGLPMGAFSKAWTASDIQNYLGISRTQTYELLQDPSAPPRLRTGRSYRYNGLQVLAWLHHQDWHVLDLAFADHATSAQACPACKPSGGEERDQCACRRQRATLDASHDGPVDRHRATVTKATGSSAPEPSFSGQIANDIPGPRVIVIDPVEEKKNRNKSWAQQLTAPAAPTINSRRSSH